jgi:hypothetical protein
VWERETLMITVPDHVPPDEWKAWVTDYLDFHGTEVVDPHPEITNSVEGMDIEIDIVDDTTL